MALPENDLKELLGQYGDFSLAASVAQPGMKFHGSSSGGLFYAERQTRRRSMRFVLGDPVADQSDWPALLDAFLLNSDDAVFLNVGEPLAKLLAEHGFYSNSIGWEALIELETYSFSGPRKQNIRNAVRRCENSGFVVEEAGPSRDVWLEIDRVSQAWLERKSVSRPENRLITRPLLPHSHGQRIFLLRDACGQVVHFVTFDEMHKGGELVGLHANINRGLPSSPKNADYAILAHVMERLKSERVRYLSLGLCPDFSFARNAKTENLYLYVCMEIGSKLGRGIYNLAGISQHKAEFRPEIKRRVFVSTRNPWPLPSVAWTLWAMNLV
jgi:lysylphosphatidylglycerol synthetase-like protein (DUF2156 family)